MWIFWAMLAAGPVSAGEQPRLLRVIYDIQVFRDTRNTLLQLALNKMDAHHFSLQCRKIPTGTWFTYWAVPGRDLLAFPKAGVAFEGDGSQPFRLFPHGPRFTRIQWLELLESRPPERLGTFQYQKDGEWNMLADHDAGIIIRWREKKRVYKDRYSERVLEPGDQAEITILPLSEFADYWETHDSDE